MEQSFVYQGIESKHPLFDLLLMQAIFTFIDVSLIGMFIYVLLFEDVSQLAVCGTSSLVGFAFLLMFFQIFSMMTRYYSSRRSLITITDRYMILPYRMAVRDNDKYYLNRIPLKNLKLITFVEEEKEKISRFSNETTSIKDIFNWDHEYLSILTLNDQKKHLFLRFRHKGKDRYFTLLKEGFQNDTELKRFIMIMTRISPMTDEEKDITLSKKNLKDYNEVKQGPKQWDNISPDHWVKRANLWHGSLVPIQIFLSLFLGGLLLMLWGIIFGSISFIILYPINFFIDDENIYVVSAMIMTAVPTVLSTIYGMYALFGATNKGGPFYYSTAKVDRIGSNEMLGSLKEFFYENKMNYRRRYYWQLGTRWYVYSIEYTKVKFKFVYDKGNKIFQFYIGPLDGVQDSKVEEISHLFSDWFSRRYEDRTIGLPMKKEVGSKKT